MISITCVILLVIDSVSLLLPFSFSDSSISETCSTFSLIFKHCFLTFIFSTIKFSLSLTTYLCCSLIRDSKFINPCNLSSNLRNESFKIDVIILS